VLLLLIVAVLALAASGATYQSIATERAERRYPPPGEMVDVGGYRLHIDCAGQGSPTVVLDGGTGETSAQWALVRRKVSRTTRTCAYDRAGMGWSERGPEPRDARRISGELHALLEDAGVEGPYVLVGHSFGGLYMQTYAARYPEEVAGMALIESSHPDQFSYRRSSRDSYEPQRQAFAVSALLARFGLVRLSYKLSPAPPDLPSRQRAQIDALGPSTRQVSTTALELRATPQTATQTRNLKSLGDKPLSVVSAGTQEPEWLELQDDLATLSSNSTHHVVEGATHTSVLDEQSDAQATGAAIVEVVTAVRSGRPFPPR
jgi:pimeloyl-ACP methyl ester carboxylesterase